MSGPLPITYQDMKAYMEVTGSKLTKVDVELIKKLDDVYLEILSQNN